MTEDELKQKREAEEDAKLLVLLLLAGGAGVSFNKTVGRFYVKGKSVSINAIRGYLLRIERRMARKIEKLVNDLDAGTITLDQWQKEFDRSISSIHILAGALAVGSIAASIKTTEVQKAIRVEQKYAARFAKQIKRKKAGTLARIIARAKSYAKAASITYANVNQTVRALFQTECRRIRRASESCVECIKWSYKWIPIKDMPRIGTLLCKHYCRCYLEFR